MTLALLSMLADAAVTSSGAKRGRDSSISARIAREAENPMAETRLAGVDLER
jgi:hypothetical protein